MVIDSKTTLERTYQRWLSLVSKHSLRTNECGDWVKLSDPKQALRKRHPMLILVWNSRILKTYAKDFVLQSSLPQLQLGIMCRFLAIPI
uniref:Uncharacterized protein n=1 Tax=Tanacetum cinerariifolium TaxID=118510 RepID=A0A699LBY4_TANCI|nr:hypothetical protein [Tanacetum cinerariifolium]